MIFHRNFSNDSQEFHMKLQYKFLKFGTSSAPLKKVQCHDFSCGTLVFQLLGGWVPQVELLKMVKMVSAAGSRVGLGTPGKNGESCENV